MMHKKRKVLIVDDDEGTRAFVQAVMANEGWETFEARTGLEAMELVKEIKPDLVILDVVMPEMDGFEVFRRLRTDYLTKDIPIVMLTAINELGSETKHDEASMEKHFGVERPEGFVDKPVDAAFLLNTIMGVVG